jgi:hypothetical protein
MNASGINKAVHDLMSLSKPCEHKSPEDAQKGQGMCAVDVEDGGMLDQGKDKHEQQ